jgi:hypothetical protein
LSTIEPSEAMADKPRIRLLGFAPKVRKASTKLSVIPFS